MKMKKVVTRQSKLALIQTENVVKGLAHYLEKPVEVIKVSTKGDRNRSVSLDKVGGKGIFIGDLEEKLLNKEADFAVHSMKDLDGIMDDRLTLAAVAKREDPRDALISRYNESLKELKPGAIIGTSSARRSAQIKALRPDLETRWIRGPIDQRIEQLREGKYDAIILAVAGLNRLKKENEITEYLDIEECVPAVAQGAIAIQCRKDDSETLKLLKNLNHPETERAVAIEKEILHALDQDETVPIGIYADVSETSNQITVYASVCSFDGKQVLKSIQTGENPSEMIINDLIEQGAKELIKQAKRVK